jgi:hypothetical protein
MSGEIPIEIEDKPTSVTIVRELVEHLQDTIEALKREIIRNPKSDEYRKALKGTSERLTVAEQILTRLRLRPTRCIAAAGTEID